MRGLVIDTFASKYLESLLSEIAVILSLASIVDT